MVDIAEGNATERRLTHMADRDPLTGVYNRRKLFIELDRILQSAGHKRAGALLMVLKIDMEFVRGINTDTVVGDRQVNRHDRARPG